MIKTPEVHEKGWGEEHWIANNSLYCGKILKLNQAYRCSMHYHKIKDETFHILSGQVFMECGNQSFVMRIGDSIDVSVGKRHRFTGLASSEILEVSTQHFENDSYREEESGECFDYHELIAKLISKKLF